MTSQDSNPGHEAQRLAPSASGIELGRLEQIRQQDRRFLALVTEAAVMDVVTLAFLALSAVIAAKYFPNVSGKLAGLWKILGMLVLALSVAAKILIVRSGSPLLPRRGDANFLSDLRRQGRNYRRLTVWFDLRLMVRSLGLGLIAFILAGRFARVRTLDGTAGIFFLIAAAIIGLNLFKAMRQIPIADDGAIGALRNQIAQLRSRIRFTGNIWHFMIPFLMGFGLLGQNIQFFKGAVPILAPGASPYLPLLIGLLAVAILLLVFAIVLRAQFRFIRGRQNQSLERLRQLEELLAELSEESKANSGGTLPS